MKKALVIGAGAQGNVVCWVLSRQEDIGAIVLADIDIERARETAGNIGSDKVRVDRIDASNVEEMTPFMESGRFDIVINVTLPEFIPRVMLAALRSRTNYVDLSSILLHSRKGKAIEQLEFEEEWKESGRTALVNGGSAPGLTNIMAREGVDELDEVDKVLVRDYSITESDELIAFWSLPIYLMDCVTESTIWEDGRPKNVPIFSGEEYYDFPPPLDHRGKVYHHCHEEPATIPLFVGKPVGYCDFKSGDPEVDLWRFVVRELGLMDTTPLEVEGGRVRPRDVLFKKLPRTISPQRLLDLAEKGRVNSRSIVLCDVAGKKHGRDVNVKLWSDSPDLRAACRIVRGTSDVSLLTSVPAAIFSLMLLRGQLSRTGVVLPETLTPEERSVFYRGIGEYGIRVHKRLDAAAT
jgi:lysine 6-dehydrogenase